MKQNVNIRLARKIFKLLKIWKQYGQETSKAKNLAITFWHDQTLFKSF